MKWLVMLGFALMTIGAVRGADITVAAGETVVVDDFSSFTYGGVTVSSNDVVTLNEGCTVKVPSGVANADKNFCYHINLLGNATLDLSDYDGAVPFRLYASVYAAKPDTFKLTVINAADKVFVIGGNTNYNNYSNTSIPMCMISRGALDLPADTKLHFKECVWLHRFPTHIADVTYDVNTAVASSSENHQPSLVVLGPDAFGTDPKEIVVTNFQMVVKAGSINSNQTIRVCASGIGKDWGAGHYLKGVSDWRQTGVKSIYMNSNNSVISNDICLAGGILHSRGTIPNFGGRITGTGTIRTMGWTQTMRISGELDTGYVTYLHGQRGSWMEFKNARIVKPLSYVMLNHNDGVPEGNSHGYDFCVAGCNEEDSYVPIGTLRAVKIMNVANKGLCGGKVRVYGKQTLDVAVLNGANVTSADGGIMFDDSKSNGGRTQLNVGSLEQTMQVYLSTNTAMTVTNIPANYSPTLNYYRESGANRTTLKFVNGSTEGTIVKGLSPSVLPRRIEGHAGTLSIGEGAVNPIWTISVDPDDADPVLDGCEGTGVLSVPASGTIEIKNVSDKPLPKGIYPIVTCTSGGAALNASDWPVQLVNWRQGNGEIIRDDTGIRLKIHGGMIVIVR